MRRTPWRDWTARGRHRPGRGGAGRAGRGGTGGGFRLLRPGRPGRFQQRPDGRAARDAAGAKGPGVDRGRGQDGGPGSGAPGLARADAAREARRGLPGVVYGPGRTPGGVIAIVRRLLTAGHGPVPVARLGADTAPEAPGEVPGGRWDEAARLPVRRPAPTGISVAAWPAPAPRTARQPAAGRLAGRTVRARTRRRSRRSERPGCDGGARWLLCGVGWNATGRQKCCRPPGRQAR